MSKRDNLTKTSTLDRLGRFIGQLRVHEGITLEQLAYGLCSPAFLDRIENGERDADKQLADAFFQRLGKPAELFERILEQEEFCQWTHRQEILACLNRGDIARAQELIREYQKDTSGVLNRQFVKIADINCAYILGAAPAELLMMVRDALELTQPRFEMQPVDHLLLSQNEGRLLFAYLKLKEQTEGIEAVSVSYHALLRYFQSPRYESRERVYLYPYIALRVIEHDYGEGRYTSALTLCDNVLRELTEEKRLCAYGNLLEWKQKLYDATGNRDRTPEKLLLHLTALQRDYVPKKTDLLIPCEERGNVHCLNQAIQERRRLLGISQESLAEDICEPRTISRIENNGGKIQRKIRRALLQRVNLSGERYDYELISDRYEDYLLRSELDRAIIANDYQQTERLLNQLKQKIPAIPANHQYLLKTEAHILKRKTPSELSSEERKAKLESAVLCTLPLDLRQIGTWPISVLSINELLTLMAYAFLQSKEQCNYQYSVSILSYLRKCLNHTENNMSYYEDLCTRIETDLANVLGDIGQYDDSNSFSYASIRRSLENGKSSHVSLNLYNIAWNLTQRLSEYSQEEREQRVQTASSCLITGYAVAQISNDLRIQPFCLNLYRKLCDRDLEL